ncbi:hypothetical protein [Bacillus atrophaeus]|uniref:hypothetical protein n=1 Tax=Bacillus atrophaeus TaxID=1452 RepID=UPI00227F800E|nr:hypothetical protein [Bacillus atrophaeus]MCY8466560.1 hypothetical protein [Bacillus atrophaeus]MCY8479020.1 hypothetical protein [Bacillus atrophaeus]
MNDQFNDIPDDIRVRIVQPKQKDYRVVAISDPVYLNSNIDKGYEKRTQQHIDNLNKLEATLKRDKKSLSNEIQNLIEKQHPITYNSQQVYRMFHSLNNKRRQQSVDLFEEFNRSSGNYYVFDIETFGDSQERVKPYGISEIALNEYDHKGNLINKAYNTVIGQEKDIVDSLQARIHELSKDRYTFNSLSDWEKRSLVDLMRYASYTDEYDGNAFHFDPKDQKITHHSIIKSVFDEKDHLNHPKILKYMDHYLTYMQSGLDFMKKSEINGKMAMHEVAKIMASNPNSFFVSYNGNQFDMPVLEAYAKRKGISLPNIKHLDYLNVIKSVYMDSDDLKRMVNPQYQKGKYGKDKLAAFRELLDTSDQDSAHNSQVDTDDTAKVVSVTRDHIQKTLNDAHTPLRKGFNYHPTEMTWNESPLYHGQTLFASGGVQAYQEGDESFKTKHGEDGKWVAESNGFNKTVINSKSFYQFAGHQNLGEDRQAFRFFNADTNEYSYIVRSGENAFAELQDFVQNRFYNWDNLDPKLKQEIQHAAETDRARRRYDRFFSMDGGGKGLAVINGEVTEVGTSGFSGLKRMLANAEIMQEHLNSNGAAYREAVQKYITEGLSRNQAKKKARKIRTDQLMDKLNFNSMWDDEKKAYIFNQKEKDHFFKMYKRLIDEMPYLNQAVNSIDSEYAPEISDAAQITDPRKRNETLRNINQKRDQSILRFHQSIVNEIGTPEEQRSLKLFESQRLGYFDPELNEMRTVNFETVETARNNIYNYAKRGIEDGPNKQRHMKERMFNLIENFHSQGKINKEQYNKYIDGLHNADSIWSTTGEIAMDMRNKSTNEYDTTRTEPSMTHNQNIKDLDKVLEKKNMSLDNLIQRSIHDTQNAQLIIDMNALKGKKLVLSEEMQKTLQILDADRFSRLTSNNYQALEDLVASVHQSDPSKHIALTMDNMGDANMKLYVYHPKDSISVNNQLQKGSTPSQALEINMPLINESGTHKIGGQVLNAHSIAVLDRKDVKTISSAEQIARGYVGRMNGILKKFNEGDIEGANLMAKRTLRSQIENMSGIQRNMVNVNDTYAWANNQSDALKQSHVKVANAMVEDLYFNGYDGIKLSEKDFYDPDHAFVTDKNGQRTLRNGLTFEDIKMESSYKMMMKMPKWAEEKLGQNMFTSSLKAEHVSKGILSTEDIRRLIPYGSFYNHGRDNAVQFMNSYIINGQTEERLKGLKGVSRDSLLKTDRQLEYESRSPNQYSFNMKTAYMSQDELRQRVNEMYQSQEGHHLLKELGMVDADGKLDHIKLPRLYEQQGIIAKDVAEALEVDNEKRYVKGKQFELSQDINHHSIIKPGQVLGVRTHDNGAREEIKYTGSKLAKVIEGATGDNDLVLQWQSDPFKIMLDGEKMTDSPVDRKFIQALTGSNDVAAIINPDVSKHKDFGMLMSGEARLMASEIKSLPNDRKQAAIRIIENGDIGLKWDKEKNLFIDHSFDINISRDQFKKVFDQLQQEGINISPTTEKGIRTGILEAHLSKVANYSKVIDGTGKKVLGFDSKDKPIYGEPDGVQWGHREMGVLKSYGLDKTYEHVYNVMKEKNKRLDEAKGLADSLKNMTKDHVEIETLTASDFDSLPKHYRNKHTYKGTIFDEKNEIRRRFEGSSAVNEHGFWFELPGVERQDGHISQVKVNLGNGKERTLDKIFIPFTAAEGANGDIHLREIQKQISNIYKRAEEIQTATSIGEARQSQKGLQNAVNSYVKQSFKELTSSQGMLFNGVFKTHMNNSASGLFKLMDFDTSQKVAERWGEGQYTVISENMAKKMGVFDKLSNSEDLYAANVRYPTFHDGAMQFTKLRMADWIKDGEMHTTSFSSMLQNADSDGDYSHIVAIDDKEIQNEWKKAHDNTQAKFKDQWNSHVAKEDPSVKQSSNLAASLERSSPFNVITKQVGNSDEQMASKIGKMTIGRASNLNLFLRQVADAHFLHDQQMNDQIKRFGQGLEQKLIDAKHGAKPAGLEMIDAIYAGKWDKAMEIDNEYFKKDPKDPVGMFQKDFHMQAVAQELPPVLAQTENGLRTQGFKFGTSTGLDYNEKSKYGIQHLVDLMHGNADLSQYGGDNKALGMWHKYLREDLNENLPIDDHRTTSPIERLSETPIQERIDRSKGLFKKARNLASDAIGGGISDLGSKTSDLWESLKSMGGKNKLLLGGALAVAGIAGYNILNTDNPVMHYNKENEEQKSKKTPTPAIQMPEEDYSTQNASISIKASGRNFDKDQVSQAVSQSMQEARMSAGPTRITINHQDNTQQLNRIWYRDKVRENV